MGDFFFQRVKIPYARGSRYLTGQAVPEALVSRKVVYREVCTEGGVSEEMSGGHFEVIDPTVGQTANSDSYRDGTDTSTSSAQAKTGTVYEAYLFGVSKHTIVTP